MYLSWREIEMRMTCGAKGREKEREREREREREKVGEREGQTR